MTTIPRDYDDLLFLNEEWRQVPADWALPLFQRGWDPEAAASWLKAFPVDWNRYHIPGNRNTYFIGVGAFDHLVDLFLEAGVVLAEEARTWCQAFDATEIPQYGAREAIRWCAVGVLSPQAAKEWYVAGIEPRDVPAWQKIGYGPARAVAAMLEGHDPETAPVDR